MKTKAQVIAEVRKENPTIQIGDEDKGYTQIVGDEYEEIILNWAEARFAKFNSVAKKESDKAALLTKLGITSEEAALLLS
jgi:hypothetical protein